MKNRWKYTKHKKSTPLGSKTARVTTYQLQHYGSRKFLPLFVRQTSYYLAKIINLVFYSNITQEEKIWSYLSHHQRILFYSNEYLVFLVWTILNWCKIFFAQVLHYNRIKYFQVIILMTNNLLKQWKPFFSYELDVTVI